MFLNSNFSKNQLTGKAKQALLTNVVKKRDEKDKKVTFGGLARISENDSSRPSNTYFSQFTIMTTLSLSCKMTKAVSIQLTFAFWDRMSNGGS